MDQDTQKSAEQKQILNMYGLFGASIILSVIPSSLAIVLSAVFFLILLVMAYQMRRKAEVESLQHNHATYVIRSIWIVALFSLITMLIASLYMLPGINYEPFLPCSNALAGQGLAALESMSTMEMYSFIEPCVDNFIGTNYNLFVISTLIAGLPLIIYMSYRFAIGLSRATKGHRIGNPKRWF